ncbi:hypothetical protein GA0061105_101773 [Rhizobium aethiopicum]|uniref:Uncharacterized protein n=1 Tax=Rhizobium aethiopicum TaxID=1138170 RepID=A0A1C3XXE8_9HYPH|nr:MULTISPECIES: hypothetical protein [Rhizobium]SCB56932.1 hypothetical protein GA0061105_101773 [Rhizobium aethiopicum]
MHDATFGETAKDIFISLLARLKRIAMLCLNGGKEDEWGYALVTEPVTDINTKMPITGHVMQKVVDGTFVYRLMTEEECEDFDAGRSW